MIRTLAAAALAACLALPALAADVVRIAFHVDENDPARMTMVLNNVANVKAHYDAEGVETEIEVVAYGPGLHMLRADTSPVKDRIAAMSLENEHLAFSACGNTLKGMTKKEGAAPELISEARVTPSGVVRLVELQNAGWAYVRP